MPNIQLYIATTIDGFIARENNSLDWLFEIANSNTTDHGYASFLATVDTVIMGRKTYDEILRYSETWPYETCTSYVVTKNTNFEVKTANIKLLNEINESIIKMLKAESNKNIWIVGGGTLITTFFNQNAIDDMILSVIPIVLGKGIRLFPNEPKETRFDLLKIDSFETGVVNLTFRRK